MYWGRRFKPTYYLNGAALVAECGKGPQFSRRSGETIWVARRRTRWARGAEPGRRRPGGKHRRRSHRLRRKPTANTHTKRSVPESFFVACMCVEVVKDEATHSVVTRWTWLIVKLEAWKVRIVQILTQVIAERNKNVHHRDGRKRSAANVSSHEERCRQGVTYQPEDHQLCKMWRGCL